MSLKKGKYKKRGDKLEVKLRDSLYNPIYKNEIKASDVKQVSQLLSDLSDNGVPIEKATKHKKEIIDEFW